MHRIEVIVKVTEQGPYGPTATVVESTRTQTVEGGVARVRRPLDDMVEGVMCDVSSRLREAWTEREDAGAEADGTA